ncbi:MAG: hypothetical protein VKL39_24250 [Leptolyngbyaceae bacterium]|nr:hypothetical protein [Leptolyngbyaceae bacterium]
MVKDKPSIREWLIANKADYPDKASAVRACAEALGSTVDTVRVKANLFRLFDNAPVVTAKSAAAQRSLSQFRDKYDIPFKIRNGIKRHLVGDVYMTDGEFRDACGVLLNSWRRNADLDEFAPYRYRFGGELLWANQDTMRTMKQIAGVFVED